MAEILPPNVSFQLAWKRASSAISKAYRRKIRKSFLPNK